MKKFFGLIALIIIAACSSSSDDSPNPEENGFNREAMLINWADNIIIPAYQAFSTQLNVLDAAVTVYTETPDETNLAALRDSWLVAYKAWQHVSMFDIGKAEELRLRDYLNVYPVNVAEVEANIASGGYDLSLLSKIDEQGFPAVDYLINGLAETDTEIIAFYNDVDNGEKYKLYLSDVVSRMQDLTSEVLNSWTSGYRNTFVNNSGTTSGSSVNKFVNDYIKYYEKALRSGKVGIPSGALSGTPAKEKVEAYHAGGLSKELFTEALNATQNFFEGKHFNAATKGESLESYLDFLNTIKEGEDLSAIITSGFAEIRTNASGLDDDFSNQVETDNVKMLETYDSLQELVILFKVDMIQALNISVDYVDTDGD